MTRLIPERNDTLENKIYYEFLDFYKLSKVNNVRFSKLGGYAKLQTLVCKASEEAWSDDDRLNFSALYTMFSQQFYALGGSALNLTPGDALLVYLSVYRYSDACQSTPAQVRENLSRLWDEIKILTEPETGQRAAAEQAEHLCPEAQPTESGVPARVRCQDERVGAGPRKGH